MKYLRGLVLCLIAGGLLLPTAAKGGFEVSTFSGGAPTPKCPNESIRMESEQVTVRLQRTSYTVDASFCFFNTGIKNREWVGIPIFGRGHGATSVDPSGFLRFDAWVDGLKTVFSYDKGLSMNPCEFSGKVSSGDRRVFPCMVSYITFPENEKTRIRIRYEAPYVDVYGRKAAYYVFGTSSFWKDKVGKAVFVIDSSDVGGTKNISTSLERHPGTRRVSENLIIREIEDFEPSPSSQLGAGLLSGEPYPADIDFPANGTNQKFRWGMHGSRSNSTKR